MKSSNRMKRLVATSLMVGFASLSVSGIALAQSDADLLNNNSTGNTQQYDPNQDLNKIIEENSQGIDVTSNSGNGTGVGTRPFTNNENIPPNEVNIDDLELPQWDTTKNLTDGPIIKRDKSKDLGGYLKGNTLDEDSVMKGFDKSGTVTRASSVVIGYLLAILVGSLALWNMLGLFYITVPVGFIRDFLSGGQYSGGGAAPAGVGMGGGMGMRGGMGMGMGMGGGMGGGVPAGGGHPWYKSTNFVPTSAIMAVKLAEGGMSGGASMGSPGMNNGMGMGMNAQQGGSAAPVRAIPYFLRAQVIDMFLLGIAIVLLVLSSVLFDTGINIGNAFVSIIEWVSNQIIG